MDPNECLRRMRDAIVEARVASEGDSNDAEIALLTEVAEYAQSLDEWLSSGGFPPRAWAGHGDESGSGTESRDDIVVWTLTASMVDEAVEHKADEDTLYRFGECVQFSSIPDAIREIASQFYQDGADS